MATNSLQRIIVQLIAANLQQNFCVGRSRSDGVSPLLPQRRLHWCSQLGTYFFVYSSSTRTWHLRFEGARRTPRVARCFCRLWMLRISFNFPITSHSGKLSRFSADRRFSCGHPWASPSGPWGCGCGDARSLGLTITSSCGPHLALVSGAAPSWKKRTYH